MAKHSDADAKTPGDKPDAPALNFIQEIIEEHNKNGRFGGRVHTRFPPEPNGYLHIGHAKSICLNYGLAVKYGGKFNLRYDDTNPTTEEQEYVDSIRDDVRWLGADWEGREFYASDYFDQLYEWAEKLIRDGKAYVDDLPADKMAEYRGDIKGGKNSPFRDRSVEENLDLFRRMKAGEFPDGARTLRAKIDMSHPNFHLRDPIMYRIMHAKHHRTGDKWCIYPMYDYAHGESDSIEGITHSICTLEFEIHRPLYDWYVESIGIYHPQQIEFARLNLTYTVLSKRKLIQLVTEKHVSGWDDPRMPTICGVRRRGYTPEAMRKFCERIGVSKYNGIIDVSWLEDALREDLNKKAPRVMGVLRPLKVVIENYPDGQTEDLDAVNNPEDASAGTRKVPFSKVLYIEQDDFRENASKDFFRLAPGREVRLRYAYFVTCVGVEKDASGAVVDGALHLRPCHSRWRLARWPQGEGDDSLGERGERGRRRGAAVRPPVRETQPGRSARGSDLSREPEPEVAGSSDRVQTGAVGRRLRGRQDVPVRAPRVLLRGPRLDTGEVGVQPGRDAAGHVGQDREESEASRSGLSEEIVPGRGPAHMSPGGSHEVAADVTTN